MKLSPRFHDALSYAATLHGDQQRKASGEPYLAHLLAVAALVMEYGGNEDEAIAATRLAALTPKPSSSAGHDTRSMGVPERRRAGLRASLAAVPLWSRRHVVAARYSPHTTTPRALSLGDDPDPYGRHFPRPEGDGRAASRCRILPVRAAETPSSRRRLRIA